MTDDVINDVNTLAALMGGPDAYHKLKRLTHAAAALASYEGRQLPDGAKALIVLEVDMKTEEGRLAKEAAAKIRELQQQLKDEQSKSSGLQHTLDDVKQKLDDATPDPEDQGFIDDLKSILEPSSDGTGTGGPVNPLDPTTVGNGGDATDPAIGQRKAPVARPHTTVVPRK